MSAWCWWSQSRVLVGLVVSDVPEAEKEAEGGGGEVVSGGVLDEEAGDALGFGEEEASDDESGGEVAGAGGGGGAGRLRGRSGGARGGRARTWPWGRLRRMRQSSVESREMEFLFWRARWRARRAGWGRSESLARVRLRTVFPTR